MSIQNPNSLRHKIHSSFETGLFGSGVFQTEIRSLNSTYPASGNPYLYVHTIQELNRKYNAFGFDSQIEKPIDAGFRPLWIDRIPILLQNGSKILTQDSSSLLLEQSI